MEGYVSSSNYKKRQRHMNRCVRRLNKNIMEDELWRGRFFIRQTFSQWVPFDDGSGGEFYIIFRIYDKKTKKYMDFYSDDNWLIACGRLWMAMNNFIIEHIKVWDENPRPDIRDAQDYRNVSQDSVIAEATELYPLFNTRSI